MSVIAVDSLAVSLSGTPVLNDVTFHIDAGQTVALLGANGSGKSTLVRAILGLARATAGTVTLLDTPLSRFKAWDRIGYVPQRASVSLHSTTVYEVVASGTLARRPVGWPGARQRRAVMAALELVGLADHAKELYLHLSGGQQQRVLIARGVVNAPAVIIMDEPFAGVDIDNQAAIAQALRRSAATQLVVLHETAALEDTIDRTLILRDGRLVADRASAVHAGHETIAPAGSHLMTGMEPRWTS